MALTHDLDHVTGWLVQMETEKILDARLPLTETIRKPSSYYFYDCFNSFFGQNVPMCFHATRPIVFSDRFSISMGFGRKVHGICLYRSFKDFP